MRSLISLTDLEADALAGIIDRGVELGKDPDGAETLRGLAVGIYFQRPSTRTRTSFWRAATRLGADAISFGPDDLQLTTGETFADTAKVLSNYLDALVVRTNGDIEELRHLSAVGSLSVVNALTEHEHPTQAVADLITLKEHFGDVRGRHLLYIGEGNSTAAALVHAVQRTPGLRLSLLTPEGYGLPEHRLATNGEASGRIVQRHVVADLPAPADAVYTSRWQTMGVAKNDHAWLDAFAPYRVTRELFDRVRGTDAVFMHDLPAVRGQDVTDDVLDGPESIAWRQAFHKMTGAMAVLEWCLRA